MWLLLIVTFFDTFVLSLIIPLIVSHVRKLGAGHIYVGILGSLYPAFQLASGPLFVIMNYFTTYTWWNLIGELEGSLSDLKGRKSVLFKTLLLCAVCQTVLGFIDSLLIILLLRAILGLFKQTHVLTKALVPDYEKDVKKQSQIYGKLAAISGVGLVIGPAVGGHLGENYPEQVFTLGAMIVGICFVVSAGLVYMLPNIKQNEEQENQKTTSKNNCSTTILQSVLHAGEDSVSELYKVDWSRYGSIFLFICLIEFAVKLHFSNYIFYLKVTYGLTPKSIGYIISFMGLIRSLSSYFIAFINSYYTEDKDYSIRNFHLFFVTCLSMLGFICSFHIYVYAIFMVPLCLSDTVAKLISLEMILRRCHDEHRSAVIGATNSVRSLSAVIAPLVSGVIGHYFGVSYVLYVCFFISALGSFVSYRTSNKLLNEVKKE